MSQLVTGDAVVLGLQPARLPSRAVSVLVDLLLAWSVYLSVSLALLSATASLDAAALAAVQVGLFVLVLIGAPIAVETLSHGRSLGKLMCGLRVVREDGGPIRFRHALVRGAIGVVEIQLLFGVAACAASLVSARGRRVGDVFAGALVVRERVPAGSDTVVPPAPAWSAGQFTALDLSRVPEGLWLAVRQYLMRAGQLDPVVSRSMAERLASDLTECTGVPAPGGVPAGEFLAGVAAERQQREARRMSVAEHGRLHGGATTAQPESGFPARERTPSVTRRERASRPTVETGTAPPAPAAEEPPGEGPTGGAPKTGFVPPS